MAKTTKVQWRRRKKDEAGISNEERAERAATACSAYSQTKGTDDDMEACIGDLMADLLHYAASEGLDPETLHRRAIMHFEDER